MTTLPETTITAADLAAWYKAKKDLETLRATEMLMRQRIFRHYFPSPKEGTNTAVLPDTYQLKGVHTINRKIVEESMQALCYRPPLENGAFGPSKLEEAGISPQQIIKWKPELAIRVYRELTAEQQHLVDQMLLVDAGSPQLKIEPPAKKRGAAKPAVDEVQEDKGTAA
jgi:hypothetical protein